MPAKQILQPSHYPLRERATSVCVQRCLKRDTEDEAKDSRRQSVALSQSQPQMWFTNPMWGRGTSSSFVVYGSTTLTGHNKDQFHFQSPTSFYKRWHLGAHGNVRWPFWPLTCKHRSCLSHWEPTCGRWTLITEASDGWKWDGGQREEEACVSVTGWDGQVECPAWC